MAPLARSRIYGHENPPNYEDLRDYGPICHSFSYRSDWLAQFSYKRPIKLHLQWGYDIWNNSSSLVIASFQSSNPIIDIAIYSEKTDPTDIKPCLKKIIKCFQISYPRVHACHTCHKVMLGSGWKNGVNSLLTEYSKKKLLPAL